MKTAAVEWGGSRRARRAAPITVTAAIAILCAGAAGYTWTAQASSRQDAETAMVALARSTNTDDRDTAAAVIANDVIAKLDALRAAAQRTDATGERVRILLDRLADHARRRP